MQQNSQPPDKVQSPDKVKDRRVLIIVAIIGALGAIIAAYVNGVFTSKQNPGPENETFSYCVNVGEQNENGLKPMNDVTVKLTINDAFRVSSITDLTGCASFKIPKKLDGQQGTIQVFTAMGNKTINQDIRANSPTTIPFYPKR